MEVAYDGKEPRHPSYANPSESEQDCPCEMYLPKAVAYGHLLLNSVS